MIIKQNEGTDHRGVPYKEVLLDKISVRQYPSNTFISDWDLPEGENLICKVNNKTFNKSPIKWLLPIAFFKNVKLVKKSLEFLKENE